MLRHARGHVEPLDFLRFDLLRVLAHHQVHLVLRCVDLREQTLQINRAAGAGGGDDEFHFA